MCAEYIFLRVDDFVSDDSDMANKVIGRDQICIQYDDNFSWTIA